MDLQDSDLMSHLEVNTLGLLRLFRATAQLLLSSKQPRFVYISSGLASLAGVECSSSLTAAYGVSKAAGNYLVKKIDAEYANVVALAIDPGYVLHLIRLVNHSITSARFVQTDVGNRGAQYNGLEQAPLTVAESVQGIANQVCEYTNCWI